MGPNGLPVIIGNHWCFAAQIVSDISHQRPSTFLVRDRNGEFVELAFEFDGTSLRNRKHLIVGNTVCIMYARRALSDVARVIRVTDSRNFQGHLLHHLFHLFADIVHTVFPYQLENLIDLGDRVVLERPICRYCDKLAKKSCVHCGMKYCSKASSLIFISNH